MAAMELSSDWSLPASSVDAKEISGKIKSRDLYILIASPIDMQMVKTFTLIGRDIYSVHSPPPGGGIFCPKCKTGKNLKEDLKKGREKGKKEEKKKRVIKHTLKYLYEA